jgi:mono/diheme cytochrome c family protein
VLQRAADVSAINEARWANLTKESIVIDVKVPAVARRLAPAIATLAIGWLTACTSAPDTGSATAAGPAGSRGERQYNVSCSGCHGANARGNGPVAPLLKVPVPDLTLIASRRGGTFPEDELYQVIDGQADLPAHGPRNMPVWGYEFFGDDPDDEKAHREATEKIDRLVEFLRSIQRPG